MRRANKKVLGVVNYEPITRYVKKGYSLQQLEAYYNPADYFDNVHIFAFGDSEWDISEKVHIHPLDDGWFGLKASLQLINYCTLYDVCILRNYEAFRTHIITAEVKSILKIPAILSLHDKLSPPTVVAYDHVFTYVEWLKETIINNYNYFDVTLLLNRIDENLFKPKVFNRIPTDLINNSIRIVSIGRLYDRDKNQSTLIKSMLNVVKKYPDAVLVLIGEGEDRPQFEKLIDTLGLTNNVRLVGSQTQEMVVEYLNWCDFHILCNPSGDLGKSLVEALIVGKPVIATGGKGNSMYHLIDGFNAKIVDYHDIYKPECVTLNIFYVIENKNLYDSKLIREHAIRKYGFEQLSQLEAFTYDKVLKDYRNNCHSLFSPQIINFKLRKKAIKITMLYFSILLGSSFQEIHRTLHR